MAINGETSAAIRDKATLGFKLLAPKIVKPEDFLDEEFAHPHAAILFAEWALSEEGQPMSANLAKARR